MENDIGRREFLKTAAIAGAVVTAGGAASRLFAQAPAAASWAPPVDVAMVKLPYAEDALAPVISARTVNLHYHKHHESYYTTLKGWIGVHPEFQNQSLEQLIKTNRGGIMMAEAVFNYSVLLNNHNWYWLSLKPKAGGKPKGRMEKLIGASYGSYETFKKTFIDEGMKLGVGWVWVVLDGDKVLVYRSEYRDTPILKGYVPLLAIDVWEHAYYMDYENERGKYLEAVLGGLLNWDFAESNLSQRKK
jgi:superoxide dismutase, Fe-Mn family